ncbi:MAG TPA: hypothetical protein VJZ94_02675 [Candidatus Paceibacterota bacterium]|nr:hypothetical protein [Candidatus Paceibacterota bacterium]
MTQIALTIHPFFKGTSMLHKVFVAVLVIIAVLCVAKITAQTFHFWDDGGFRNMAPYIQFKMTKR